MVNIKEVAAHQTPERVVSSWGVKSLVRLTSVLLRPHPYFCIIRIMTHHPIGRIMPRPVAGLHISTRAAR